jgi:DNA-binding transcriptional LysR family regulator
VALLERELGVRLLERQPHGVVPTAAGVRLAERGAVLAEQAEALRAELRAHAGGARGRMRLGYSTSVAYGTAPALVDALRGRLPGVEIAPTVLSTPALPDAVRRGRLDLALLRCGTDGEGLRRTVVRRESLGALVHCDHPLARQPDVEPGQLAGIPIALHERAANPGHYDLVVGLCRAAGFEPELATTASPFDPAYRDVTAGGAVRLVGEGAREGIPAPLVWRPLRGAPRVEVSLLERADEQAPVVVGAADALRAEAARRWR